MSDIIEYPKPARKVARSQMRSLLTLLPDLLKLLYRLVRDTRVAKADKLILVGTIIYVISPLDLIPDFIPFIGQVDDIYLVAIALIRLINNTSADVVQEHWDGRGNIKSLVATTSNIAQYFLPKRLRHVLAGKLEHPTPVADFQAFAEKREGSKDK